MSNELDRIKSEQDPLTKLIAKIPGFNGYIERSDRRTADKMLRDTIAQDLEVQYQALSNVQIDLINGGAIDLIDEVERAIRPLRTFIDRIRNAAYGYAGFFDKTKVDKEELDQMYQFDLEFVQMSEQLKGATETLSGNVLNAEALPALIRNVQTITSSMNTHFEKRTNFLDHPSETGE